MEQYFPVVLFVMSYKIILNFEHLDEIQAKEWQYFPVVLFTVYAVQGGSQLMTSQCMKSKDSE